MRAKGGLRVQVQGGEAPGPPGSPCGQAASVSTYSESRGPSCAGAAYNFGQRMAHFELGIAGMYGRSTRGGRDTAYCYDRSFSDERFRGERDDEFPATWHLGGLVTAGVTFDLGRSGGS